MRNPDTAIVPAATAWLSRLWRRWESNPRFIPPASGYFVRADWLGLAPDFGYVPCDATVAALASRGPLRRPPRIVFVSNIQRWNAAAVFFFLSLSVDVSWFIPAAVRGLAGVLPLLVAIDLLDRPTRKELREDGA